MSGKFSEIKTATTHDQAPRHCDMVPVPLGLQPKTMCIQSCFCSRWEYTDLSFLSLHPQKVWEQRSHQVTIPRRSLESLLRNSKAVGLLEGASFGASFQWSGQLLLHR
mmetsp:Transcript_68095/g.114469  ORF Transcript_68095/g.114469 Transcript_68095/m.114469 type:complete len:108 (+) Transcript_68095:254-577(+)